MQQQNLHEVAIGYLLAHQGEHLSHDRAQLVARCATHLQEQGTSQELAQLVALKAIGELDSRGNSARVDLNQTTSYAVFLVDPASHQRYAFTAASLLRIARESVSSVDVVTH